jgi:hypothetical protein
MRTEKKNSRRRWLTPFDWEFHHLECERESCSAQIAAAIAFCDRSTSRPSFCE